MQIVLKQIQKDFARYFEIFLCVSLARLMLCCSNRMQNDGILIIFKMFSMFSILSTTPCRWTWMIQIDRFLLYLYPQFQLKLKYRSNKSNFISFLTLSKVHLTTAFRSFISFVDAISVNARNKIVMFMFTQLFSFNTILCSRRSQNICRAWRSAMTRRTWNVLCLPLNN